MRHKRSSDSAPSVSPKRNSPHSTIGAFNFNFPKQEGMNNNNN